MADYHQSRSYPPNHLASGSGTGMFWVLFAIAGLGIIVLIGAFGGGSTSVDHPGGAGADPIVAPVEPEPVPTEGTTVIE